MRKILIAVLLLVSLLPMSVSAEENVVLEAQLASKNAEITDINGKIQELENRRKDLKKSVLDINNELKDVNTNLEELAKKLEEVQIELDEAQTKENEKKDIFYKRLVVMYEKGNMAYLEVIFDSDDIMEMSKRAEYIKQISECDRKIFDEFANARKEVDSRKQEVESISNEYQAKKSDFDAKLSESNAGIETVSGEIKQYNEQLKKLQNEKKTIEDKIYKQTFGGRLFAEAEKYLGYPYVWGGSTPETSFDCSGFVCWSFTNSGVYNLPRTTAQGIYNQCKKISPSEARAGDLIFFENTYSSYEPVTHIGIYAGNNRMLHCGNPIQYTSTQSAYWKSHFYGFGRLEK